MTVTRRPPELPVGSDPPDCAPTVTAPERAGNPIYAHQGEEIMRPLFLIPAIVIMPFVIIYFLKMMTGDPVSAVFLALILFVTVAAWFAGASSKAGRIAKGS